MYVCMYVCVCAYVKIRDIEHWNILSIFEYVCMCVCMYVFMHVCVCVCAYVKLWDIEYWKIGEHDYIWASLFVCMFLFVCMYATCSCTYEHIAYLWWDATVCNCM